jgi:hypothetical protein
MGTLVKTMKSRLRVTVLAVVASLSLTVAAVPGQAFATDVTPTLIPLNDSKRTSWESFASWNPITGVATLCAGPSLTTATSSAQPWVTVDTSCESWTPADPTTGVFEVDWNDNHAVLVISDRPTSTDGIAVIVPDYTWQAYNKAGAEFYKTKPFETGQFNLLRPQIDPLGIFPDPIKLFRASQSNHVRVIQQSLLDDPAFSYALSGYSTIVIYGHDEYWTRHVSDLIKEAVNAGTGLLNLSGNTGYRYVERDGTTLSFSSAARAGTGTSFWFDAVEQGGSHDSLLGATFVNRPFGYSDRTPLARTQDLAIAKRWGAPKNLTLKTAPTALRGIRVTNPKSLLFKGLKVKKNQWLGLKASALGVELDGIPLDAKGKAASYFTKSITTKPSFSAESWIEPSARVIAGKKYVVRRAGFLVTNKFGQGRVFTAGSIGWTRAMFSSDGAQLTKITLNALAWVKR